MNEIKKFSFKELNNQAKENVVKTFPESWVNEEIDLAYESEKEFLEKHDLYDRYGFYDATIGYQNRNGLYDFDGFISRVRLEKHTGVKLDDFYDFININFENGCLIEFYYYPEDVTDDECDKIYDSILKFIEGISNEINIFLKKAVSFDYDDNWKWEFLESYDHLRFTENGEWLNA